MADGRHFENGFIVISQPEIIRFQWNLVRRCRLCFQGRLLNKMLKFCKFIMADGRHIENRLLTIYQRMIIGLTRNFVGWMKHNHILTQDTWPKYQIWKIQDGGRCHFENVLSLSWVAKLTYLGCHFVSCSCKVDFSTNIRKFYGSFNNILSVLGKKTEMKSLVFTLSSLTVCLR